MSKIILPYCEKEESDIMSRFFQCFEKSTIFLLGNVGHYQSLAFQAYRGQKKKS